MNEIEKQKEQEHLDNVLKEIDGQIDNKNKQIEDLENEMAELNHHFSDQYYFLDDEETVVGGNELDEQETLINQTKEQYYKLKKQRLSPYFGKISFKEETDSGAKDYYIGIFNLTNGTDVPVVCDWRAPISTMFYDYEIGKASYRAPIGLISGDITSKRQFKIKDSKMEWCFDSSLTIDDDILQKELSQNSSQKMKNIVSTIQREQNSIIRDESNILFVQGVAGSGKTSIALHRVAYLLYKYRDKYKSSDILIISPNSIFSEYISNVLPSLGEENIVNISFMDIAKNELSTLTNQLETREQALEDLTTNTKRLNEVAYKNCFEFADSLKQYLNAYVDFSFNPKDFVFGDLKIKKEEIEKLYSQKYKDKTPAVRISWIADYILDKIDVQDDKGEVYARIKKVIYPMFISQSLTEIYADFLANIGLTFSYTNQNKVRYEDIAPILYIKNYLLGLSKLSKVKYLVIDEMQDYNPLQFEMFDEIFACPKTMLGDMSQCIEKLLDENDLDRIAKIVEAKEIITLNKTYRSTCEITHFADSIKGIHSQTVDRHGEEPQVFTFDNIENECKKIVSLVNENASKFDNIAIICKNKKEAEKYYSYLYELDDLKLMDDGSLLSKIMIMPASICKGLEFDMVILPNVSTQNYNNFLDKNLLYVSSTRALHKLYLTSVSDVSKFIKNINTNK